MSCVLEGMLSIPVSRLFQNCSTVCHQIEEKILLEMQCRSYFSLMTDKSNDIAVLKQLVLVGRYKMSDSGVKTSFLHIQDM